MKISQDQKTANRKAIIQATITLSIDKGFKAATMRQIAREAGLGDATVYNYFPTKEAILYGYYQDHMEGCIEMLKEIPDFSTFTLQEQLQTFFDTGLNAFLAEREFVRETFPLVWLGGSRDWGRIKPVRSAFLAAVDDMLLAAVEVGEIPEQVFQQLVGQFFMDAYIAMVHYWLADRSDGFADTRMLTDRGLDLACAMLKAGIANKLFDMAIFLFKTHVLSRMDRWVDAFKSAGKVKRAFMERMDDK